MNENGPSRIIDANSNRAREGARVLEDVCRFILEDAALASRWKKARHSITEILRGDEPRRIDSRDPGNDPGGEPGWDMRKSRADCRDIAAANAKRVEEGLRVLEEFSRIACPCAGDKLKKLRFEIYGLEKETLLQLRKQKE